MKKWQYDEIMSFLKDWVREEGLCRFCHCGRLCGLSRRGRQECPNYRFANEMDCFHLWIAFFDGRGYDEIFRPGYDTPDSYPWMNEPPEADIPPGAVISRPSDEEMAQKVKIRQLRKRKYQLMQEIEDLPRELEKVEAEIKRLEKPK